MKRVQLRPMGEDDLAVYFRWQDEEKDWERYTCRPVERVRPYAAFRAGYLSAVRSGQQLIYSVVEGGAVVGRLTAFDHNPRNKSMEIGYYLCPASRGQGIGSRALRRFSDVLFSSSRLDLHKIYATTSSDNLASQGILRKAGFHGDGALREHYLIDGTFHDQLLFSLLRREWERLRES